MAERSYEAYLETPARRVYDALTDEQKRVIERLVSYIELDPHPDGRVKVVVNMPPVVFTVYTHPNWWTAYTIPQPGRVGIAAIAPSYPPPRWAPR